MRKISAHYVFTGNGPVLRNGIVTVDDQGMITEVEDTEGQLMPSERLEHLNGILVPGFVNAHCHLELSHLKGLIPPHQGLSGFLSGIMAHRNTPASDIERHARKADQEMFSMGIRAVGDISNTPHTFEVKKLSKIRYHTFVELTGLDPEKAETIFSKALWLNQKAAEQGLTASITAHAAYSVSDALAAHIAQHASSQGSLLSIHHQESEAEDQFLLQGTGPMREAFDRMKVLPGAWKPGGQNATERLTAWFGSAGKKILLVHNTFVSGHDILMAKEVWPDAGWVLCPSSNWFIGQQLPDVRLLAGSGVRLCLGTDSSASNTTLSILHEMKLIQEHFPEVSLRQLIEWATYNGAKALGMEQETGSMEPGKYPGLNLITGVDYHRMKLTPQSEVQRLV